MERLHNDPNVLRTEAHKEIHNLEPGILEKEVAFFSQLPAFPVFPFCITVLRDAKGQFRSVFRQWDSAYDLKRWKDGIYNLDRLRIVEDNRQWSTEEIETFCAHLQKLPKPLPAALHNEKAIVLDGCDWSLKLAHMDIQANYQWRAALPEIERFAPLVDMLLAFHTKANLCP